MADDALNPTALRALFEETYPTGVDEEIGALLEHVIAGARARHPGLSVSGLGFARHLVERLPADAPITMGETPKPPAQPVDALLTMRVADLYLAYACCAGDHAALAIFEESFSPVLRLVLARARGPRPDADDFRQACLEKLLAGARPKLLEYSGQGDLQSFLRVTLLRLLIDLGKKRTEAPSAEPEKVLAMPALGDDPELEYLKSLYRGEFQRAFEEAALDLSAEDRNLLRYHFTRGLTVDQIGALYHVHRATAARRVARARDELLGGTRRRLMARLGLGRSELESVMRMIESDLHVSVHRILGEGSLSST